MKTKNKTTKTAKRKTAKAVATRESASAPAFAYDDRVPVMADALRKLGGSATAAELFKIVKSAQFLKLRRIPATIRQSAAAKAMFENTGGVITFRKSARNGKTAKRSTVSKRETARAK